MFINESQNVELIMKEIQFNMDSFDHMNAIPMWMKLLSSMLLKFMYMINNKHAIKFIKYFNFIHVLKHHFSVYCTPFMLYLCN